MKQSIEQNHGCNNNAEQDLEDLEIDLKFCNEGDNTHTMITKQNKYKKYHTTI